MKLKKAQGATGEKSPKNDKEKKLHKANDNDEEVESDTADYLKVSTSPNKKPKVPAPEADSEEDDLEVDDEDDEDDDELDEESPEDEELDDSEGFSDEDDHEVPQLVAAGKAKAKKKPAPKKAALEEGSEDEEDDEEDDSDSDDEEEDDDDDDDGDEDDDEEEDMVKMKKVVKAEQAKRKATDDGPTEQTSKKAKQGDGIPGSLLMDVDEYDKLFLYVGNLPKGCTVEEVKDLSPDIVSVRTNVKLGEKLSFAFVEFKSEADADRNFKRLQKASLRGHPLRVGYRGAKRADLPSNWQEVQNELCVYNLPEGLSQHRVARLFPTATNVSTMAFYTLVTFESKDALLAALKNNACHSMDGNPLKFSYRLKPAGAGKKKKIRRKKLRQRQQQTERGKSSDSKPGRSSEEMSESKKSTVPGKKLFVKQTESPAQAKTSKAKFDAKRKEVKKVAQSAKQRKVQKQ